MIAQFDVYRNSGKNRATIPYIVVVQSSYFEKSRRRVVVPLVSLNELSKTTTLPASTINPIFTIEGDRVVLNPLEITSIPTEVLGDKIGSMANEGERIIAALDELLSRAWR